MQNARKPLVAQIARNDQSVAPVVTRPDKYRCLEPPCAVAPDDELGCLTPGAFHELETGTIPLDGLFIDGPHAVAG